MKHLSTVSHHLSNCQKVLTVCLVVSLLFIQSVGSFVTFEIQHTHAGAAQHIHPFASASSVKSFHEGHTHCGHHHDHAHDHHRHSSDTGDDGSRQDDTMPSTHSHLVVLNMDVPASCSEHVSPIFKGPVAVDPCLMDKRHCPEGPLFELIKPPQLV